MQNTLIENLISSPTSFSITMPPEIERLSLSAALKEITRFWPLIVRFAAHATSSAVMAFVIEEKSLELLAAYTAYETTIDLCCGFLESSTNAVLTYTSDAKAQEDEAIKQGDLETLEMIREKIRSIWHQGLFYCTILSVPAVIFGVSASPMFKLFNLPSVVLDNSKQFLYYSSAGFVAEIFYTLSARLISGLGVLKSILVLDILDHFLKFAFSYAFLEGKFGLPELGIAGVGLAYSISKIITCTLHYTYLFVSPTCCGVNLKPYQLHKRPRFDTEQFKKIISAGFPEALASVFSGISSMMVMMFCGQKGTGPLIGLQAANVLKDFSNFHMCAVLNASCNRIGQYHHVIHSENQYSHEERHNAIRNTKIYAGIMLVTCFILSLISCALSFLVPTQLIKLLIHENKSSHMAMTVNFVKIQGVVSIIEGLENPANCILSALLDNKFILWSAIAFELILNAGAASIVRFGFEKDADWVFAAANSGAFFMMVAYMARCYIKLKRFGDVQTEHETMNSSIASMQHAVNRALKRNFSSKGIFSSHTNNYAQSLNRSIQMELK